MVNEKELKKFPTKAKTTRYQEGIYSQPKIYKAKVHEKGRKEETKQQNNKKANSDKKKQDF